MNKKRRVVVLGASTNPARASFQAVQRLVRNGFDVYPVGMRSGEIDGLQILTGKPAVENVDTLSLYVSPKNQPEWYEYILAMKPRRVLFNPGTENPELELLAEKSGIGFEETCTLVLLSLQKF